MTDADVACYVARYKDVLLDGSGVKGGKDHFKKTGNQQGRLPTCARDLTDYEAGTYLHTFPELQVKFGDGPSAIKQARKHYVEEGINQARFKDAMKDVEKGAWKCGVGAKQSCKCHGTLWYGPTKAPDDKKTEISTWEALRHWKTLSKSSEEWMSCTDAEFGGDPWPEQEKQCWCEPKPAYKPWYCGDEGDECPCDGGFVVYGSKLDDDKKPLEFFGVIKKSLAIVDTKGRKQVACSASSFDGADPAPDGEKACFCDRERKFFDKAFVTATRQFWKASALEKQSTNELKRTKEHNEEVAKIKKEKAAVGEEQTSSQTVENEKAVADISAAKVCAIQSIEEAYKFKKLKLTQKRAVTVKTITSRRSIVTKWNFQLNIKKNAAEQICALANSKKCADKPRMEADCKRLTGEIEELVTQIQMESEKITSDEKAALDEITKQETELDAKRLKDTIAAEQKADEDNNEVAEGKTEKDLDLAEEKEALITQQQELIKIQQKTSHKIDVSIKEQQKSIGMLIKVLRKKLTKIARREQILVSELSDDAPEREKVISRILSRSKETITKLTTVMTTLTDKVTSVTKDITGFKDTLKELTDKISETQAKTLTMQETLKLKVSERRAKKEIMMGYAAKAGEKTPSSEAAFVTAGAITKLSDEIKELRKLIKTNIAQKNESFATKVTTQKQIDLFNNRVKIIEGQVKSMKAFIADTESTIEAVENKIKEELATKTVIETQKAAFKANQEKVDAEESVNSARIIAEKEKATLTEESKECKKKLEKEKAEVKSLEDQLKSVKKAQDGAKADGEKTKLESSVKQTDELLEKAKKIQDETDKECTTIDDDLKKIVEDASAKIEKLTKAVEEAKEKTETAEKEAKASIVTLPGGEKDQKKAIEDAEDIVKKEAEETKTSAVSTTAVTVTTTSANNKTATGKPKAPLVPPPKPKKEEDEKEDDKKKEKPTPVIVTEETPVIRKKKEEGEEDDSDDDEPEDVTPTEVPGGEKEIEDEVVKFTKDAHNKRVDLVKTKETLSYELKTIRANIKQYKDELKKVDDKLKEKKADLEKQHIKIDAIGTKILNAADKAGKAKLEAEKAGEITTLNEMQQRIAAYEATVIEWKAKMTSLTDRRKQIKYIIEVKVLESKEAEQAVLEAIKTVTDVELMNRKRWLASKTVGDYKKCSKFMGEYTMIYQKQGTVIASELADHQRRLDVASGAITSLKEKKSTLKKAKESPELTAQLDKIDGEIDRHTKTTKVEEKVLDAVREKKTKNEKEYKEHVEACQKLKGKAKVAVGGVNDAATTLKNQREYQVQVTNLKNVLISSHEEALTKREEARKVFQNYTNMVTKYEQQLEVAQESIMEAKTKVSAATEMQRLWSLRLKELATLLSRSTITAAEKTKLSKEEAEVKEKFEVQTNVLATESKALATLEGSVTTLTTTITSFKKHIVTIGGVVKELEKKVKETKNALKPSPRKGDEAPPVKGKASDKDDADEKDEDGDEKVDEDKVEDEKPEAVGGGNEKVDKELDQADEEAGATTTQIDSLTKTLVTTEEKSEEIDKKVTEETTDVAKEEAELLDVRAAKARLGRRRERQRCQRLFPQVFASFKLRSEIQADSMCPCPGSGKGLTQVILDGIEDPGDFDKYVLGLFEKNLAVEGTFQAQMQRYYYNEDKVVSEETNPISLRLVTPDDKVDEVMQALDAQNLALKSTDAKLSPLLKGKTDYLRWQQSAASAKQSAGHVSINPGKEAADGDGEDDEE
jgi:hypothetical protein